MKTKAIFAMIIILGLTLAPTAGLAATAPTTCGLTTSYPCCYEDETGWGDGIEYNPGESWAMYTPYYGYAQSVILWAGQNMNAGTINFSDPVDGMVTITIVLKNTWHFDFRGPGGVIEASVHIQDYMDPPPVENPAPGQFDHHYIAMGGSFSTTLPVANFYGVHAALIHVVPCPPVTVAPPAAYLR